MTACPSWPRIAVHSSCRRVWAGAGPPCTQVCGLPRRMLKLGGRGVWLGVRTEGWGGGCAATLEEGVRIRKCGEQSSHSAPGWVGKTQILRPTHCSREQGHLQLHVTSLFATEELQGRAHRNPSCADTCQCPFSPLRFPSSISAASEHGLCWN